MSGITGLLNLDGSPADRSLVFRMMNRLAHRGSDGSDAWFNGPLGMAHLLLHSTPDSLDECQPLANPSETLCLTLDGRIDNRDELCRLLADRSRPDAPLSDAQLLLLAYDRWGAACPERIIGDFAFALWDRRDRQLFCARDALGTRPLFYARHQRRFLWASEPRSLLEDPGVRTAPDEGMIGEYLAAAVTNCQDTLFQDIKRLPPAHCLTVRPDRPDDPIRIWQYWDIDPSHRIRYRHDGDYAAHFLDLFRDAVRCSLRSHRPVRAELSGGLDSSSIVATACSLIRDGSVASNGFETLSLTFPGKACDETSYILDMMHKWRLRGTLEVVPDSDPHDYAAQVQEDLDLPDYPNGMMSMGLLAKARDKGAVVVLNGSGGDEWLGGSYYHYADLVRSGRLFGLMRRLWDDRKAQSVVFPSCSFLRLGFWPNLPRSLRIAIRVALGRKGLPQWISPAFARRIGLLERLEIEPGPRRCDTFAQEDLYRTLRSGWQAQGNEAGDRALARCGIEQRSPFNDRRIIEFAFAIPEEQRWRHGKPKFLLRQAMTGLLPESIRNRTTKADFSHTFVQTLRTQGGARLFESLKTEQLGWINGEEIRRMYRHMEDCYRAGDQRYTSATWPLWMVYGIELWLRALTERKGARSHGETRRSSAQAGAEPEALQPAHLGGVR
ncbi:MAG TPA: asparagine synthase-related protein [Nitrospiraceae bacterium]|nr:asparagine synthase-related protein [Nitrospiraceae bacterium]